MKITVLGCGTSTGVPIPGCYCPVCRSDDPHDSRFRTSCAIQTVNGETVLLDASPDLRSQVLRAGITSLEGVLFTHSHADHVLGVEDLRPFTFSRETPLPCYADAATGADIRRIFSYIFAPDPNHEGGTLAKLQLITIVPGESYEISGLKVTPLLLRHGRASILGFRINDFGYATDCNFIPEESIDILRGVEVLFIDGLRFSPPHPTHFTIPEASEVARQIGAQRTYFIHQTHTVSYANDSKRLPDGMFLAYDGLEIEVG